jgi:hypothetical protein
VSRVRTAAMVNAVAAMLLLSGCTPSPPIGVRLVADRLTVLVGEQCRPETQLAMLRVTNFDRATNQRAAAPLWEIVADQPSRTRSVTLGEVPAGYRQTVSQLATQRPGATVAVDVQAGRSYSMLYDRERMRDGKVLDGDWNLVSEARFFADHDCG